MVRQFSLHTPITQSSVAAGTAVTVTFSKFFAEAGPGISFASNRRNCALTFGVKYLIPLLCLLATHTLSFSQSPSRFLIRSCDRRLCEFFSGFCLARHWASNPRSEATISWMPESLLPSSQSTTVWTFFITILHWLNTSFSVQGQLIQATARSNLTGPVAGELGQVIFKVLHAHSPGQCRKGLHVPWCLWPRHDCHCTLWSIDCLDHQQRPPSKQR